MLGRQLGAMALGGTISMAASGCGEGCTEEYVCPGYRISLVAADTGRPLCAGEVRIAPPAAGPCSWGSTAADATAACDYWLPIPTGAAEATLTASHDGYETQPMTVSTQYETDDCGHAEEVAVTMWLTPAS